MIGIPCQRIPRRPKNAISSYKFLWGANPDDGIKNRCDRLGIHRAAAPGRLRAGGGRAGGGGGGYGPRTGGRPAVSLFPRLRGDARVRSRRGEHLPAYLAALRGG